MISPGVSNFFGRQFVCHCAPDKIDPHSDAATSLVDDHAVPAPYFGAALDTPNGSSRQSLPDLIQPVQEIVSVSVV